MSNKNKLWRIFEDYIARVLNLKRIAFSGASWPNKEDLENDNYIVQCKFTEGKSISITRTIVEQIGTRALIQHKIPMIAFGYHNLKYDIYNEWIAIPLGDFILLSNEKEKRNGNQI